jgi:hypothetical protein
MKRRQSITFILPKPPAPICHRIPRNAIVHFKFECGGHARYWYNGDKLMFKWVKLPPRNYDKLTKRCRPVTLKP